MIDRLRNTVWPARIRDAAVEREKMARLEAAERDLRALQARGQIAVKFLIERHEVNHWRESIEKMIQGVH